MAKLKALREIVTTKGARCLKGMEIPVGTTLHVMKESPPVKEEDRQRLEQTNPKLLRRILVVRVDNGTGHLDFMYETAVCESDVL